MSPQLKHEAGFSADRKFTRGLPTVVWAERQGPLWSPWYYLSLIE